MHVDFNPKYPMKSIDRVFVDGYCNIDKTTIDLQKQTALLATNNYGKSNLLDAIDFGCLFIRESQANKKAMMQFAPAISINDKLAGEPFSFEVEGHIDDTTLYKYGYSFIWRAESERGVSEAWICREFLKIKKTTGVHPEYSNYIIRDGATDAKYLSSEKGRCSTRIAIDRNALVLNKLANFDNLFCINIIRELNNLVILNIDTLDNPAKHFDFSIGNLNGRATIHIGDGLPQFLFSLKKNNPDKYEYLKSAIMSLVPTLEEFDPVPVKIGELPDNQNLPYKIPTEYDVIVKDKYNNQPTRFAYLSTGCMKLVHILSAIVLAKEKGAQLVLIEELENSVHPKLLRSLLSIIEDMCEDVKVLFTSHSPQLAQFLSPKQLYVGLPNCDGVVDFRTVKANKVDKMLTVANEMNLSLGEYLFMLMEDMEGDNDLIGMYFNKKDGCNE